MFRRQLSSLRDKLDIMNYTTGDLNSRLSGGYEGRRSWLPSDRTGARTHRDITRSLPEFNESRTQERFDAKNKLRATLLQVKVRFFFRKIFQSFLAIAFELVFIQEH